MLSIRMRRTGAKKNPHFRVVVADSSNSPDGAFIEVLGHYHPRFEPARVVLDMDALKAWIEKGARPSDTVRTLMKQIETGKLEMTHEPAAPTRPPAADKPAEDAEAAEPASESAEEPEPGSEAAEASDGGGTGEPETTTTEEPAADGDESTEEPAGKPEQAAAEAEAAAETEAGAVEEEERGDEEENEEKA